MNPILLYPQYILRKRLALYNNLTIFGFTAFLVTWSWLATRYDLFAVFGGLSNIARFLFIDFLPPNINSLSSFLGPTLDTLCMSYVGAVISVLLALVISFLTASVTTPHPIVAWGFRSLVSMLRCVPALIWGLVMVSIFGLGSFAGAMALAVSGVGVLGKAFAESIDEVDRGQLEAVKATGANWLQLVGQAVWPQITPAFASWSLFKLDLNIRNAAVIGMVGAGGLGFALQRSLRLFRYRDAIVAILLVFALIAIIELATTKIRERLL